MTLQTYYDILGVSANAAPEVIHAAYQTLARKYTHSTSPEAGQMAALIKQAYDVLSDPVRRSDYDAWLRLNQTNQPVTPVAPMPTAAYHPPKKGSSAAAWIIGVLVVLLAVAGLAYYLVSSTGFFGNKDEPVQPIDTSAQTNTLKPVSPIDNGITAEQQNARNQAHADYLAAVNRINAVWNSLPKNTRNALRDEQRAINAAREANCQAQAVSEYSSPIEIETARYRCEVPLMDERTNELRVYIQSERNAPVYDEPSDYDVSYDEPSESHDDSYDDPVSYTKPAEARAMYDEAVANINAIWNSLSDETRNALRDEQRAINAAREAGCKAYARNNYSTKYEQDTARYLCEVPELNDRAAQLQEYE
ncbi:DnaJ domain-containing protein [Moraxella cuniculi]|uniref:Chaperone protein DnaJ n=1 Tax=Moraxella cuniculi TaxID=34061 RepID=A0A3S4SBW4_9GAMM|nr:DnaJ domain-containing protein [Moraxella cuniculi]VEG12637.1 Chaperone protein DnaJ [Moraxella cuniculi]